MTKEAENVSGRSPTNDAQGRPSPELACADDGAQTKPTYKSDPDDRGSSRDFQEISVQLSSFRKQYS